LNLATKHESEKEEEPSNDILGGEHSRRNVRRKLRRVTRRRRRIFRRSNFFPFEQRIRTLSQAVVHLSALRDFLCWHSSPQGARGGMFVSPWIGLPFVKQKFLTEQRFPRCWGNSQIVELGIEKFPLWFRQE
jgi:hypothetical protein